MADLGFHSHFRLPPDNVGKRMKTLRHCHIKYDNGLIDFYVGAVVIDDTTGAVGLISDIFHASTTVSGDMTVAYAAENAADFEAGSLLKIGGSTYATISLVNDMHIQGMVNISANNPHHGQFVDNLGSAYIRYSEGEQQLDAFGLTRKSSPNQLGSYYFGYDDLPTEFSTEIVGTASSAHIVNENSNRLTVDSAEDDKVSRTTNRYHIYQPGFGQLINMTITVGDSGKTGVVRGWGAYDDNDGVFFQHDEDHLSLVVRSSVTGSVVETRYDITDWNGDIVDGSGGSDNLSEFNLDISKSNIYWIDYQWLGTGRVRFGIIDKKGNRVTMHTVENSNTVPYPYMKTGSLPLRHEIYNIAATGSASELKMTSASVVVEGNILPDSKKQSLTFSGSFPVKTITANSEIGYVAFRPAALFKSIINRKVIVPQTLSLFVEDQPVLMKIYKYSSATGGAWGAYHTESTIEANTTLSDFSLTNARPILSEFYETGSHYTLLPKIFGYQGENVQLNADGSQPEFLITFESLTTDETANVRFLFSWIEIG